MTEEQARKWIEVPVIEPIDPRYVWEHTPVDYYRYGEYPRIIRPVRPPECKTQWRLADD